ncbi:MAG: MoxR family ATPase [Candidatus Nanopelagicales bacterium]
MTPEQAQYFAQRFEAVVSNVERFIQGKDDVVRLALVALLAEGHLLMEDVPGTGKTSLARSLSASLGLSGSRIQFTPDLLPSDVTGVTVFHQSKDTFEFHPGPVFANVVLADEINRASPKTQSAMLEVMAERTVTVDGRSHPVPRPFLVLATQNPVDMDGTYPLPEAQLDRFMMRISVGYPDPVAETQILKNSHEGRRLEDLRPVSNTEEVTGMIKAAGGVHIADSVLTYIVGLVNATRNASGVRLGSSPRGGLALLATARVRAASRSRHYVTPEDVEALIQPVLAHRLVLAPEAIAGGASSEQILAEATRGVPVPQG